MVNKQGSFEKKMLNSGLGYGWPPHESKITKLSIGKQVRKETLVLASTRSLQIVKRTKLLFGPTEC